MPESAKVYVLDFHFSSDNEIDISRKKTELDKYFDSLRDQLENDHNAYFGKVKCEVFLRKH